MPSRTLLNSGTKDELTPPDASRESDNLSREIQDAKIKLENLKNKRDKAAGSNDFQTASDLELFAIPDITAKIKNLVSAAQTQSGAEQQAGLSPLVEALPNDAANSEQINAVVVKTDIPFTGLHSDGDSHRLMRGSSTVSDTEYVLMPVRSHSDGKSSGRSRRDGDENDSPTVINISLGEEQPTRVQFSDPLSKRGRNRQGHRSRSSSSSYSSHSRSRRQSHHRKRTRRPFDEEDLPYKFRKDLDFARQSHREEEDRKLRERLQKEREDDKKRWAIEEEEERRRKRKEKEAILLEAKLEEESKQKEMDELKKKILKDEESRVKKEKEGHHNDRKDHSDETVLNLAISGLRWKVQSLERWAMLKYHTIDWLINVLMVAQISLSTFVLVLGATGNQSQKGIIILGTFIPVTTGILAIIKVQGLPGRFYHYAGRLRKVSREIGRLERIIASGGTVTGEEWVSLHVMFNGAQKESDTDSPDKWSVNAPSPL